MVIEMRVRPVVGISAQPSLVLDLAGAVAQVKADLLVLCPDLVAVAPPSGETATVALKYAHAKYTKGHKKSIKPPTI
jgi:hypothetical protein